MVATCSTARRCRSIFPKKPTKLNRCYRKKDAYQPRIADLIANGMKSWAKSLNVTHYTHWFQPLTDGTAEKHDGFIEFGEDGGVIERFSGKLLIQQNRMPLLSLTAVSATLSKHEDIQLGCFFTGIRGRHHSLYPHYLHFLYR